MRSQKKPQASEFCRIRFGDALGYSLSELLLGRTGPIHHWIPLYQPIDALKPYRQPFVGAH